MERPSKKDHFFADHLSPRIFPLFCHEGFLTLFFLFAVPPEGRRACPNEHKASRLDSGWIQIGEMTFRYQSVGEVGCFYELNNIIDVKFVFTGVEEVLAQRVSPCHC